APAPRLELLEALLQLPAPEVGPELVAEDKLRVGALPEQVVGDALLAAGPDQQVGIVHLGRIEAAPEVLLGAAGELACRVEDLGAAAIVEGDEEDDPLVGSGRLLGPLHPLDQLRRHALAAADEAHPHALLLQLRRL